MSALPVKRDGGHNSPDGLAKKRRKGATRLKLRCDRSIPCSSCVKRGCGAICPDGSLTTGQGNRFVLASTQELHEKISELANRVRELEDALRSSHSHLTSEQHPLLSEELLRIKAPLQREVPAFRNQPSGNAIKEEEHNPDVVDAFGSLSISLSGGAKYFGTTANSWNETAEEEEPEDDHLTRLQSVLPAHILTRAAAFPISPVTPPLHESESLRGLFWFLPPSPKAAALRDIYFTHAAWMYAPISPESFEAEVYSQFYYDPNAAPPPSDQPLLAHRLSLMFIVLAIGSLMDTNEPAYNLEAEKYHQLARAALFLNSFFDQPTITAVQSLFLMAYYLFLADRHGTGSGARWAIMGIAVKVAQNRDSGRWKVDPIETQRRRELFWELFTYDSWQCLTFGRPTAFAMAHVDCKMPYPIEPADDQAFFAWKHRFCSECMILFHDQAFGAKTPTYATVLQLDRKMRAFPVPPILQVAGFGSSETRPGGFPPETIMLTLQRHIVLAIREMNLLYLHRSFFARAISDHPKDPLGSPYGTSVIAAYRSAGSLVALMRNLHSQLKEPSERVWFLWTHMFSCAIILGSIVTRCPSMSLAPSALVQLDSACELFSKAARGFRAGKVLNIMLRLQEKAHHSLEDFRKGKLSPAARRITPDSLSPTEDNDELSTLGGKTRLVAKKEPVSPLMLERSPTSHNPVVPLPLSPSLNEQVHPSVLEYLNTFQPPSAGPGPYSDVDVDLSPVSMYGMSAMQTSYHSDSGGSYVSHSPTQMESQQSMFNQNQSSSPHAHNGSQRSHAMNNGATQNVSFPQYFPVYDYRTTNMNDGYASNVPILEVNPMPGQRRASGSPEGNMQSSIWQDFVGDLMSQS
ncbi:fungal-specific transcription factor domain-containing protein [Mycena metata]|uniref:Fungal-specific transcription factor domain-containing protein n=1 Tax=Mycena metata TaxID=1033252 RepID=A0AAD7IIM4_9AGAR|nr:fungal-specific transcription factor domain-containing protein [Mycena metata]